jgi:hypothetical protein
MRATIVRIVDDGSGGSRFEDDVATLQSSRSTPNADKGSSLVMDRFLGPASV